MADLIDRSLYDPLPFDPRGEKESNKIKDEATIEKSTGNRPRLAVLKYGRFYTRDMVVKDANGTTLTRGKEYVCKGFDWELSSTTGLEVCQVLSVTDDSVKSPLTVTYQAVGGESVSYDNDFRDALDEVRWDKLSSDWSDVFNKPTAYPAADHEHQWYDLYAMSPIYKELIRIQKAIELGKVPLYDKLLDRAKDLLNNASGGTSAVIDKLNKHLIDYNDPHEVTPEQLGYGNLPKYGFASDDDIKDGADDNDDLVTVSQAEDYINDVLIPPYLDHVDDYGNPHDVTADQADTYSKEQIDDLLSGYLDVGGKVKDAHLLNGDSVEDLIDKINNNIDISLIKTGVIDTARLGGGDANEDSALRGDLQWKSGDDIFGGFEYDGDYAVTLDVPSGYQGDTDDASSRLSEKFGDDNQYPNDRTYALYSESQVVKSDNGAKTERRMNQLTLAIKRDGWFEIHGGKANG